MLASTCRSVAGSAVAASRSAETARTAARAPAGKCRPCSRNRPRSVLMRAVRVVTPLLANPMYEVAPTMRSYALNAKKVTWMVGVGGVAVRTGTRCRRPRGNGDAVTNRDRVVADENLLDEESDDPLPFQDVERLGRRPQARQKRRESFSQAQMRGTIVGLFHQRVQLALQRLLALTQQWHPLA